MNYLSKNLRQLRKAANLNQSEIQDRLGVKRNTWSNWETGHTEPNIETLVKITDFFKISLSDLIQLDLSDVQVINKSSKQKNVQPIIQPIVQPIGKKYGFNEKTTEVAEDATNIYQTQAQITETLSIAVRGLEASNAALLKQITFLENENTRLQQTVPSLPAKDQKQATKHL